MRRLATALSLLFLVAACAGGDDGRLVVYTSVTQDTVDAVVGAFQDAQPGVEVEVFRAPTGEVAARIAAEERSGGLAADVLWLTDPLSMYRYQDQGLLRSWQPDGAGELPAEAVEETFWGTRRLHMVAVVSPDSPVRVESWADLLDPELQVVVPDPGFAGSALAALGYLGASPDYGPAFFEALFTQGGGQVSAPGDVVTAVAEGRFAAGITLEFSARQAIAGGAPLEVVWPSPGAITFFSPIAAVDGSGEAAQRFIEFVLSESGQSLIASTGWFPAVSAVAGPERPEGSAEVFPDWRVVAEQEETLLEAYRAISGG